MRAFSKSRRIFWNALMDFIKEERSEMRKRGTSVEEKKLRAEEKGTGRSSERLSEIVW